MGQGKNKRSSLTRGFLRVFFKIALIILSIAGCTQSVTWIGEVTETKYDRRAPSTYGRNNATFDPEEEVNESNEKAKELTRNRYSYDF